MLTLLLDRKADLVEVASGLADQPNKAGLPKLRSLWHVAQPPSVVAPLMADPSKGHLCHRFRGLVMKCTTRPSLSIGEIVWAVVTIASFIALFRCLSP